MSTPTVEAILAMLLARGVYLPEGKVRAEMYGDSPELSRELIELIRSGRKRAGTGLVWAYEHDREDFPEAGQVEVIVDHDHKPVLVTRLTSVTVTPFGEVSAEYAAIEARGMVRLHSGEKGTGPFSRGSAGASEGCRPGRCPSFAVYSSCLRWFSLWRPAPAASHPHRRSRTTLSVH